MSNYNDYESFAQYMAKEKIGTKVNVRFKMPPIPTPSGELQYAGTTGTLLAAFEDGILLRLPQSESFFKYTDLLAIDFVSSIEAL